MVPPLAMGLIMVANRGPVVRRRGELVRSSGGLVTALDPALRKSGGQWVFASHESGFPELGYGLVPVQLTRKVETAYYNDVANAALWPLLHGFTPSVRMGEVPWDAYVTANERFAEATLASSRATDLVWIHDYHLTLVPELLRRKRPRQRIGWFCHIPWPGEDQFRAFPWSKQLIEGLLGADLVAFHSRDYASNFLSCVARVAKRAVDYGDLAEGGPKGGEVRLEGRAIRVKVTPIGIPTRDVRALVDDPKLHRRAAQLKSSVLGRRIILGVDRLDYTKGIPERFLAYEQLLTSNPSLVDEIVFVQVAVPSRTKVAAYASLKDEIDRIVGWVNGKHGHTGRVPIHYRYQHLGPPELYAHYLAADVALLTPLRDGMNLVAQEYVASRHDGTGVLILSDLAGVAEHLTDALLVNPYDLQTVAQTLATALAMPREEQTRRMRHMQAVVEDLDVHRWAQRFLTELRRRR